MACERIGVMLALALAGCGGQQPPLDAAGSHRALPGEPAPATAGSRLDVLRSGAGDAGFAQALAPRAFEFPRDHGAHPEFRHEWWYLTGQLRASDGERFGFELTFFRLALVPPPVDSAAPGGAATPTVSRWRTRQLYVAHFAITDIGRRSFHSTARYARDALGLAGARTAPLRVWLDGWSLAAQPATQGGADAGTWTLMAADQSYALTLRLQAESAPVLNGDRGLSVKSDTPGAASYYYSIPRLAARGELRAGNRSLSVEGLVWLDREWGSGALGADQTGWDWFALQLADGSALMFYALRDRGDRRDPHSAGTFIGVDGHARALGSEDVAIEVQDHWRSPEGVRYPAGWHVRIPVLALDVVVSPVVANQELETTPRYWEGAVGVAGRRGTQGLSGQGYVELVGYAGERSEQRAQGEQGEKR
ncbi:MAG TPA: lipocalin-like domain-containing protein [Steroidobacteraceae bacterium]|nr:lipocalin-like domain-containing protein [Steroidobacteraceae bacterium]